MQAPEIKTLITNPDALAEYGICDKIISSLASKSIDVQVEVYAPEVVFVRVVPAYKEPYYSDFMFFLHLNAEATSGRLWGFLLGWSHGYSVTRWSDEWKAAQAALKQEAA